MRRMDREPSTSAAPGAAVAVESLRLPDGLTDDSRDRLLRELDEGEELLWVGQPVPAKMLKKALPSTLFAIPWTAFAVFWTVGAATGGGLFGLFGVPFILIGLGMFATPLWAWRDAQRTVYALTTRRALVLAPSSLSLSPVKSVLQVTSFPRSELATLSRTEASDGSGDLVFHEVTRTDSEGSSRTERRGFLAVADVQRVERLLRARLLPDTPADG